MMDDEAIPRSRRQRPKDSFQNELQAKLHQRKSLGLSADITDSDDDALGQSHTKDFMKKGASRPSAAKRRQDKSPDLSRGLGTTTMRARDLSTLMGRSLSDDEDEEVMAANLGRGSPGGSLQYGSLKSPSPKLDSLYGGRSKTPTRNSPKDQSGKLDSIFGRKTPTRETSPKSGGMSKEDIIFGRKTPVDGKKSPLDSSLGRSGLPGMGEKQWQPPNFRSASPGSSEHSRGSRGVTPTDALDTISETPREKMTPRMQRGHRSEQSPRQLALDERPKPQARSRPTGQKTPPLIDPRRMSPSSQGQEGVLKRSSPSIDLFGGKSRAAAAQEVDKYIEKDKNQKKLYGGRFGGRSPSPDSRKQDIEGRSSPNKQGLGGSGRFTKDGRKTPTDRKTPTSVDRKIPVSSDRKTPTGFDRKTPTIFDKKTAPGKRDKLGKTDDEILQEKAAAMKGQSLLDFLTEDATSDKPKTQTRRKKSREEEDDDDIDGIFVTNKKMMGKSGRRSSPERPKSAKKSTLSAEALGEVSEPQRTIPKQRAEDTSSLCEEIPLDPDRVAKQEAAGNAKHSKQRTERAQADSAIDTIADAQMKYIEPDKTKKMRPVTASAKVQHRPKPRYGNLPGEANTLQERQFNSTGDIREAIYEEWYKERLKVAKKKKQEEEKAQKEKEAKEKKEKVEKRLESEASYRCWMEKKKERIHEEEMKKRRKEREKEHKEKEEQHEKKIEAIKSFAHWKEKKDNMIKKELHKKKEEEMTKKENEEYEKRLKNKERETAFRGWQNKKEKEWKKQTLEKKSENKTKKQIEEEEKAKLREKEEEALDRYYDWVERKERQAKLEKKREKQRRIMGEDDYKPAWSPASRTIPFGS